MEKYLARKSPRTPQRSSSNFAPERLSEGKVSKIEIKKSNRRYIRRPPRLTPKKYAILWRVKTKYFTTSFWDLLNLDKTTDCVSLNKPIDSKKDHIYQSRIYRPTWIRIEDTFNLIRICKFCWNDNIFVFK